MTRLSVWRRTAPTRNVQEFLEAVEADENVTESMSAYTTSMDGEANGVTKTVNLVVPE